MLLYLIATIKLAFFCYTLMLIIRIIALWIPNLYRFSFIRFISHYTDPYLNLFRRFIPPIGGTLDISPIIAFFALQLLQKLLLTLLSLW